MNSLTDVQDVTTTDLLNMAQADVVPSWAVVRTTAQLRSFVAGKLANTALADVDLEV